MNQKYILDRISTLLARFQEEVRIDNANGEFSINIHAENVLLRILNIAYGLDLVNVNYEEGKTFPAIDLKDEEKKTAFQISSSGTVDKVVHTLREFAKNGLDKKFDHLYFYFLKGMDKNVKIDYPRIVREMKGLSNVELFFLDHAQFYLYLNKMNDLNRLIKICSLLESQFSDEVLSGRQNSGGHAENTNKNPNVHEKKQYTNKDLVTPFTKSAANSAQGGTYVPRNDLLEKIDRCFSSRRIVFLSGMGGCGKSELARAYAEKHYAEYDEIFWLTCTDGVVPDLMTLISEAEPDLINKPEKSELKALTGKALIIVDNCNADEPRFLNDLDKWTGNAHILITTRLGRVGDYGPDSFIPVESDDPEDFAFSVFKKNYCKRPRWHDCKEIRPEEKQSIHEICRSLQYNTMAVSLVAIHLRDHNSLSIPECAKEIRKGVSVLDGNICYSKDNDVNVESPNMKSILQRIFKDILDPFKFDDSQKEVLTLLSLAPASWFEMDYIYALLDGPEGKERHKNPAEALLDRGLLQGDGKRISLHPLILEVISDQNILIRDSAYYEKLLLNYLGLPSESLFKEKFLANKILNTAVGIPSEYRLAAMLLLNHPGYENIFAGKYPGIAVAYFVYVVQNATRSFLFRDLWKEETYTLVNVRCKTKNEDHARLLKIYNTGVFYQLTLDIPFLGKEVDEIPDGICAFDYYLCYCSFSSKTISIGKDSFYRSGLAGALLLPDNLTSIGYGAFYGCSRLYGALSLPDSLISIGDHAFDGCTGLNGTLSLPDGLISIGDHAFHGCKNLHGTLSFPEGLTYIGDYAFFCCSGLQGSLSLPDSLISISNYAFDGCSGLNGTLEFPDSLIYIGDYSFNGCSKLNSTLSLPDSLTYIGDHAFSWCSGLHGALSLPDGLTCIGDHAFDGCTGLNGTLSLPNSLTHIGSRAFSNCSRLNGEFVLPDALTYIGDFAFEDCSGLNGTLSLPGSLKYLGDHAFDGCSGLTKINSPKINSLKNIQIHIGNYIFNYYNMLFKKLSLKNVLVFIVVFILTGILEIASFFINIVYRARRQTTGKLTLPKNLTSIDDYAFTNRSGLNGSISFPDGLTYIGKHAFDNCSGLDGSLSFPDTLTYIGDYAFDGCTGFTGALEFPANLAFIGNHAFSDCTGLNGTLSLPDSLTSIGNHAFSYSNGLKGSLSLPANLSSIGDYTFYDCKGLDGTISFPNSLTSIGNRSFSYCSGLNGSLSFPDGLTSIGDWAFNGCSGLDGTISFPNGLTSIGMGAFDFCSGLNGSLTLPDSLTSIGDFAFRNCSGLDGTISFPDGLTSIGAHSFSCCSGLNGSLSFPDGLTSIGDYAFYGCSGLGGTISFPDSLVSIGDYAFSFCDGLVGELLFPNSLTSIGDFAFADCNGLSRELTLPENLASIGDSAFFGYNKIKKITFLNPLTEINNSFFPYASTVICGYKHSTAEKYAKENNMNFEEID